MPTNQILNAIVIGAGWAGLGVSDALRSKGLSHRVLERGRIGETWRTQRWDSFRMNTPNVHAVMPGDQYQGLDPEGVMTRNQFVALLEDFAVRKRLPLELNTTVTELVRDQESGAFCVSTPRGAFMATNVVIASGNLNCPVRPSWPSDLPSEICQIDASDYRNANRLRPGAVLVVGSGQSGGQIAEDLIEAKRKVFLASSRVGRKPRRYRGRDLSLWLEESGLYDRPRTDEASGLRARPLVGADHTISLQSLGAQGVTLLGRFTGVEGGQFCFADNLLENLLFGDQSSAAYKREVDAYILRAGINAPRPVPDAAETVDARVPNPPILLLDPRVSEITTVVWCTGFKGNFNWVRLPGILDSRGQPIQKDSITTIPGVYFAGLDLGSKIRSGTILAIAAEASIIVNDIIGRMAVQLPYSSRADTRAVCPRSVIGAADRVEC
jgi:putative flavoprotein involved in K+ transport